MASSENLPNSAAPSPNRPSPPRSLWGTVRTAVVSSVLAAILGTVGISAYDTGEIQVLRQQITTSSVQSQIDKEDKRIESLDKQVTLLRKNIEHPDELHGVPCSCVGIIGTRQEHFRISFGADCNSQTVNDLKKAFPDFRCHPVEE